MKEQEGESQGWKERRGEEQWDVTEGEKTCQVKLSSVGGGAGRERRDLASLQSGTPAEILTEHSSWCLGFLSKPQNRINPILSPLPSLWLCW